MKFQRYKLQRFSKGYSNKIHLLYKIWCCSSSICFILIFNYVLDFLTGFRLLSTILTLTLLNISGLGPGTLVGSAAFDLFPIHAVCVVVPKAGELKKIADLGVWLVELFWSFWAYIWLYIILEVVFQHSYVWNILSLY